MVEYIYPRFNVLSYIHVAMPKITKHYKSCLPVKQNLLEIFLKSPSIHPNMGDPVIDCRTMKPIGSNFVWGLVVAGLRRQNLDGGFLSADDAKRDWGSFLTTAALHAAETTGSCGTEYFTSVCCLLMVKQLKEWATLSQM
jgi:hypothetical protein